jgi:hypothetical protein
LTVLGTEDTGQRQPRDTDSIGHTRHRTKTIQRHWQYWAHKTQDKDNPEKLTVLGTQDKDNPVSGLSLSCVLCVQYCQCLWIVFILCRVYPILSVSLDCLCPVSCMSNTLSVSWLSLSCVLFVQYCQCLWIVFVLCLVCPILSMSLDCLCPVSCVPNTANVSGLSLSSVLCVQYCPWLWIVFSLCLVYLILLVSLDCLIQRHWQYWTYKTQDKDNPEKLTVLGTQDTGQRQSRDTDNIGQTRHRTKTIQRN